MAYMSIDPGHELRSEEDGAAKSGVGVLQDVVLKSRGPEKNTEDPRVDARWKQGSLETGRVVLREGDSTRAKGMVGLWVEGGAALVDKAEKEAEGYRVRGEEGYFNLYCGRRCCD